MVHNKVFEDGRKAQLLEAKLVVLCQDIDQLGLAFGAKVDESPYDLGLKLQTTFSEYEALMNKYGEEIPIEFRELYEEAQRSIQ